MAAADARALTASVDPLIKNNGLPSFHASRLPAFGVAWLVKGEAAALAGAHLLVPEFTLVRPWKK